MIIVANPETKHHDTDTQESQDSIPDTILHAISHRRGGREVTGVGHLELDKKKKKQTW